MDTSNPGPLLLLGGGVLIALGSILDWFGGFGGGASGLNTDLNGLFGIIALLIGIGLAAVGGIKAFSPSTSLPDNIAGFTLDQISLTEALAVFVFSFSLITESGSKIGLHLTWIGAAVAIAGSVLALRSPASAGPTTTI